MTSIISAYADIPEPSSGHQDPPIVRSNASIGQVDLSDYVTRKQDGYYQLELIVQGAHCGGCRSRIERGIGELVGVSQVRMNLSTLRLVTTWTGEVLTAGDITTKLSQLGFGSAPYQVLTAQTQSEAELKTLLRAMAVAGFAAMNVMLLSIAVWSGGSEMSASTHSLLHWVSALIALPTVAYSGRTFFSSAWQALKNRQTNMDVPISLALILACALSLYETIQSNPETYFDAAVMLLFLLLIGRFLDAKLRLRTGDAARRLAALQITSATRILKNGSIETVPASSIHPDDTLLIPAGQRIPVDGIIIKGVSDVDVQIVTGETSPKSFGVGGRLYSGTTNLTAPLTLKAVAASSDSFLSEITMLVEAGEQSKSKFVRIADRAARAYVPVVHTIALATFIGWLWAGGDLRVAALNAIAVLIITCPCALGLAVPAVQIVAAGKLFKHGVLIKSGNALERLAKTKSVIFDKTGTLTTGQFTLLNFDEIQPQAIKTAAALAHHSNHPLARALHGYKSDLILTDVEEKPGLGLSGFLKDKPVLFGSADFTTATYVDGAASTAWLKIADDDPILFTFADQLREDAQQAVEDLIALSLRLEMLSGDRNEVVKQAASDLGISQWRGEVTPRQKMNLIHQRWAENYYPLMVGDGINDAPALAAANASASLTGASDISRSASDIILQGDRLSGLPIAINIARQAQSRVIENLTLAVLYNLLAIPLAVFGFVNPLIAALAMSGSSLLVTLNALRISRS